MKKGARTPASSATNRGIRRNAYPGCSRRLQGSTVTGRHLCGRTRVVSAISSSCECSDVHVKHVVPMHGVMFTANKQHNGCRVSCVSFDARPRHVGRSTSSSRHVHARCHLTDAAVALELTQSRPIGNVAVTKNVELSVELAEMLKPCDGSQARVVGYGQHVTRVGCPQVARIANGFEGIEAGQLCHKKADLRQGGVNKVVGDRGRVAPAHRVQKI